MNESLDALLAGMIILILVLLAFAVFVAIVTYVCNWILFTRAGEPGWAALIPFYNTFTMSKIAFGNYRWAFAWLAVYVVNIVCTMMQNVITVGNDSAVLALIQLFVALISMVVSLVMAVVSGIHSFFYAKSFGKSTAFCVLTIFFTPIMLIIMAIDKNNTQYVGYSDFGQEWFDNIKAKF